MPVSVTKITAESMSKCDSSSMLSAIWTELLTPYQPVVTTKMSGLVIEAITTSSDLALPCRASMSQAVVETLSMPSITNARNTKIVLETISAVD